jgi:Meckel syndrome type 1 protein
MIEIAAQTARAAAPAVAGNPVASPESDGSPGFDAMLAAQTGVEPVRAATLVLPVIATALAGQPAKAEEALPETGKDLPDAATRLIATLPAMARSTARIAATPVQARGKAAEPQQTEETPDAAVEAAPQAAPAAAVQAIAFATVLVQAPATKSGATEAAAVPAAKPARPEAAAVAKPAQQVPAAPARAVPAAVLNAVIERNITTPAEAQPVSAPAPASATAAPAKAQATVASLLKPETAAMPASPAVAPQAAPLAAEQAGRPSTGTAPRSAAAIRVAAQGIMQPQPATPDAPTDAATPTPAPVITDTTTLTTRRAEVRLAGTEGFAATPAQRQVLDNGPRPAVAKAPAEAKAATPTPAREDALTTIQPATAQIADTATPSAPAPSAPAQHARERIDFATLVDSIARARDEAAGPVAVSLTHGEFGKVSLRFNHRDDGLSVTMASADPGFAPAVAAARDAGQTATNQDAPRSDAQQPQQRSASANTSGNTTSGGETARQDGSAQNNGRQSGPAANPNGNPGPARSPRARDDAADGGIFA